MMNLPQISSIKTSTTFVEKFKGYSHTLRADAVDSYGRAQMYDMQNMWTADYPALSTRQGVTEMYRLEGRPSGIHNHTPESGMACLDGKLMIFRNGQISEAQNPDGVKLSDAAKEFATSGVYTFIAPDCVIYDASEETDEQAGTLSSVALTYTNRSFAAGLNMVLADVVPCDIEGNAVSYAKGAAAPSDTSKHWYDTSTGKWKKYSTTYSQWVEAESSYSRVMVKNYIAPGSYERDSARAYAGKVQDFVGMHAAYDTIALEISESGEPSGDTADMLIFGTGEEAGIPFIVISTGDRLYEGADGMKFAIGDRCPELDHICTLANRIWGCSNSTHEIFSSKLGNPRQWFNFAGIASDSFALSTGSAEEMTCAAAYGGYPTFFTETKVMRIYGSYPSAYQMYSNACSGVRSGAAPSAVTVDGVLYYVSPEGVEAYDGSMPQPAGGAFRQNFFWDKDVCAGRDQTRYVLSASKDGEPCGTFCYDASQGTWSRLSEEAMLCAAEYRSSLMYVTPECCINSWADRSLDYDCTNMFGKEMFDTGRDEGAFTAGRMADISELKYYQSVTYNGMSAISPASGTCADGAVTCGPEKASFEARGTGCPVRIEGGKDYVLTYDQEGEGCIVYVSFFHADEGGWTFISTHGIAEYVEWAGHDGGIIADHDGNELQFGIIKSFVTYDVWTDHDEDGMADHEGHYMTFGRREAGSSPTKYAARFAAPEHATHAMIIFGATLKSVTRYTRIRFRRDEGRPLQPISWMAETGWQGLSGPDRKYYSRIRLRADFAGSLLVEAKYRDGGAWEPVYSESRWWATDPPTVSDPDRLERQISDRAIKPLDIPINVKRTDMLKLRLSGTGKMTLYSIAYSSQGGSDRC